MLPLAFRVPGFVVLRHKGRSTGRTYQTPLNSWLRHGEIVVPLTYGDRVDWLRNAMSAGHSEMFHRGRWMEVGKPRLLGDEECFDCLRPSARVLFRALAVTRCASFPIVQSDQRSNTLPDSSD